MTGIYSLPATLLEAGLAVLTRLVASDAMRDLLSHSSTSPCMRWGLGAQLPVSEQLSGHDKFSCYRTEKDVVA